MKSLIALLFSLSLISCAGFAPNQASRPQSDSSRDPAAAKIQDVELTPGLETLVGFWKQSGAAESPILRIDAEIRSGELFTEVRGISLLKDFGYNSLGFGTDDAVGIQFDPDRNVIEGLIERTLDGEQQLLEFTFKQQDGDHLSVQIKSRKKTITQEFSRIHDVVLGDELFTTYHKPHAWKVIRANLYSRDASRCNRNPESYIVNGDLTCLKATYRGEQIDGSYIKKIVGLGDVEILKFLLNAGMKPDVEVDHGKTLPEELTSLGMYQSSVNIGEHGYVNRSTSHKDMMKILIESGANFNRRELLDRNVPTPFGKIVALYGGAGLVELMLKKGADINCRCYGSNGLKPTFPYFFFNSEYKWGQNFHRLLDMLLNSGANLDSDVPNFEFSSVTSVAQVVAMYGDVKALQMLKARGSKFSENIATYAHSELRKREDLDRYIKYTSIEKLANRQKIKKLQANISYLESLSR